MSAAASMQSPMTLDDIVDYGLARLLRNAKAESTPLTDELDGPIERLMERARSATPVPGWIAVANRLELTHLETLAGTLALRCEWDKHTADCLRRLQSVGGADGAARPSLGLIVHLWIALDPRARQAEARLLALLSAGRAVTSGTLVLGRGDVLTSMRTVAVHPALVPPLLDNELGAAPVASFGDVTVRCIDTPQWFLPESWRERLAELAQELRTRPGAHVLIRCRDPLEARGLAAILAAQAGHDAVEVPLSAHWPGGLESWLFLRRAWPIVRCDAGPGERVTMPAFARTPVIIAAGIEGDIVCLDGEVFEWRPAIPTLAERREVLRSIIDEPQVCEWLARSWRAGIAALHDAASSAVRYAQVRGGTITIDDARAAVAAHGERVAAGFGGLAQAMNAAIDDDVLVTSKPLRRELNELRARCTYRETLCEALGAAVRARSREGVTALFVGPSGTGKTLAVQWLAHMLHKPLLRVDASTIASKYIGETEKNLARLLAQAEHVDSVLLFDEADALFGRRTEVKESNDRFANAQTNYLLTRIESFGGIAVLTSNSKARFDDAFMRRLDAVIEFPLPDASDRAALWRAHLGARRPPDSVINLVAAQAELAGGHIRNAAIAAALRALERGENQVIRHDDLVAGIAAEYRKLGRPLPDTLLPR